MKTLMVMRHAKSSWKDSSLEDHERPLKKRGKRDTIIIQKKMIKKELIPDFVLCSSAVRAKETAEILLDNKKISSKTKIEFADELYMAEPDTIINLITKVPNKVDNLLIIGHNPGLESLIMILEDKIESLSTATVAVLKIDIDSWSDLNADSGCKLKTVWKPSDLK